MKKRTYFIKDAKTNETLLATSNIIIAIRYYNYVKPIKAINMIVREA